MRKLILILNNLIILFSFQINQNIILNPLEGSYYFYERPYPPPPSTSSSSSSSSSLTPSYFSATNWNWNFLVNRSFSIYNDTLLIEDKSSYFAMIYIFDYQFKSWTRQSYLCPDISSFQNFNGFTSLNLREDIALIAYTGSEHISGRVYVFQDLLKTRSSWSLVSTIFASNGHAGNYFGASIINIGTSLFIGSPGHRKNFTRGSFSNSLPIGCVYVFSSLTSPVTNITNYIESSYIDTLSSYSIIQTKPSPSSSSLPFPRPSPSTSTNTSSPKKSPPSKQFSNSTSFKKSPPSISNNKTFNNIHHSLPSSNYSLLFGSVMANSDDSILVGVYFSKNQELKVGAILIEETISCSFITEVNITLNHHKELDNYKMSLALWNKFVVIGVPWLDNGQIIIFTIPEFTFSKLTTIIENGQVITPDDGKTNDNFGSSLAFTSENTLYVGSPYHQETGVIYVYTYSLEGSIWFLSNMLVPESPYFTRLFGSSISTYGLNNMIGTTMYQLQPSSTVTILTFNNLKKSQPNPYSSSSNNNDSYHLSYIISIVVSFFTVSFFVLLYSRWYLLKKKTRQSIQIYPDGDNITIQLQKDGDIDENQILIEEGPPIGRGGFGIVKKGTYRDGTRIYHVAIKLIHEHVGLKENVITSFNQEAKLMSKLKNPFIVQIYGMCNSMLVMELMSLGSLYCLIEKNSDKILNLGIRIQIMLDVIRGLNYLHENNIIHGDMKSPNILLCEEGGSLKAKISDFGLSKVDVHHSMSVTIKSHTISLLWSAPELLSKQPRISKDVDIYAYGTIIWELITLRHPYENIDIFEVCKMVVIGNHEIIPDDCPEILRLLIEDCWKMDHNSRPSSKIIFQTLASSRFLEIGKNIENDWPKLSERLENNVNYGNETSYQLNLDAHLFERCLDSQLVENEKNDDDDNDDEDHQNLFSPLETV